MKGVPVQLNGKTQTAAGADDVKKTKVNSRNVESLSVPPLSQHQQQHPREEEKRRKQSKPPSPQASSDVGREWQQWLSRLQEEVLLLKQLNPGTYTIEWSNKHSPEIHVDATIYMASSREKYLMILPRNRRAIHGACEWAPDQSRCPCHPIKTTNGRFIHRRPA